MQIPPLAEVSCKGWAPVDSCNSVKGFGDTMYILVGLLDFFQIDMQYEGIRNYIPPGYTMYAHSSVG